MPLISEERDYEKKGREIALPHTCPLCFMYGRISFDPLFAAAEYCQVGFLSLDTGGER